MNCMKCGAELKNSGVFCEECLLEMEKYPVKPNITVTLPDRQAYFAAKRRNRKQKHVKLEEQIRHLKRVRNWLIGLLIVALLAFAVTATMILYLLEGKKIDINIGQNYETVEPGEIA